MEVEELKSQLDELKKEVAKSKANEKKWRSQYEKSSRAVKNLSNKKPVEKTNDENVKKFLIKNLLKNDPEHEIADIDYVVDKLDLSKISLTNGGDLKGFSEQKETLAKNRPAFFISKVQKQESEPKEAELPKETEPVKPDITIIPKTLENGNSKSLQSGSSSPKKESSFVKLQRMNNEHAEKTNDAIKKKYGLSV